jgi:hypothetical protein
VLPYPQIRCKASARSLPRAIKRLTQAAKARALRTQVTSFFLHMAFLRVEKIVPDYSGTPCGGVLPRCRGPLVPRRLYGYSLLRFAVAPQKGYQLK